MNLLAGIRPAAHGGSFSAGQSLLVGEEGPEVLTTRRPSTVIPNNALGGSTYFIDARGTDRAGLKNLERVIRELNGSIEERAVSAVQSSRARSFSSGLR